MKARFLRVLGILLPLATIASIWIPPLVHYWVASPGIDQTTLTRLRTVPTNNQLLEIEHQNMALPLRMSDAEILEAANRLRAGYLELKGYPSFAISLSFDKEDLRKGLPTWGLHFGSLAISEILARAYEITHDDKLLSAALQHATGFIEYERTAWLPEGFIWNDHAISGRISTLIKLWRVYRNHPLYDPTTGRKLLEHILRCRNLLAKDSHFTFNTNHGVMQNISLLQIAAAFPRLTEEVRYRNVAIKRLDRQLGFYVNDEGVVLEHSAEYHVLGSELIGIAVRLLQILGETVPPRWNYLHLQSKSFIDMIRLPDDSLPMFGNTNSTPDLPSKNRNVHGDEYSICAARRGTHLYPVAGYAVLWNCGGHSTQSLMALSQFVGHGHKHADELSLLTWTRDSRWLTSVGYWPYGVPGDEQAYGWEGSNAPHWIGEPTIGERDPQLLASATSEGIAFLDAGRNSKDGTEFRRQVFQFDDDWWIVLDFVNGPPEREAEVLWTFYPGANLSHHENESYLASFGEYEMLVNIESPKNINHQILMAERSPWRGWVVKDREPAPAGTILARFTAGAPLVSSFRAANRGKSLSVKMKLTAHNGPADWELAINIADIPQATIKRHPEGYIELKGVGAIGDRRLTLTPAPDIRAERATIRAAYSSLQSEFPRYRDVSHYRVKATKLLLAILAVQEILLVLLWVYRRPLYPMLRLCEITAWIGGSLALHMWYFS